MRSVFRYKTNDLYFGSSILVDKTASEVNANRTHKNLICVCECETDNIQNLQKVWVDQGCSRHCRFKNDDFNNVLEETRLKKYYQTHPTLFFVDPFGYDLKMAKLSHLMTYRGSEIIVNFMYDWISRFLSRGVLQQQLDECFGSHDWVNALSLYTHDREMYLVNLYKENLKKTTEAKYVFAYKLSYPNKDQTYYYLVHVTNDIEGITYMKNAFASVNNGHIQYLGRKNNNFSLFDLDAYKQSEIEPFLYAKFNNQTISFQRLWELIVEDTAMIERDIRVALQTMEKDGKVIVNRIDSALSGIKGNDEITFKVVK